MVYLPRSGLGEGRPEGGNTEGHKGERMFVLVLKEEIDGLVGVRL